ncbi:MAG: hydroxyisourate hydrolase [Trueperaceae bacterium]|nr:hydroxyisourate hydrolase [Trueperaceae bacterium]
MGKLSTHVLDTAQGKPAANLAIDLYYLAGESRQHLASFSTNQDGRTDQPLLVAEDMVTGVFELVFHVGQYFDALGLDLPEPKFIEDVPVRFGIADTRANYHVPLLVSPFAYSTYRGS